MSEQAVKATRNERKTIPMKYAFFWIPVTGSEEHANKLNQFLSSHAVITTNEQFVSDGSRTGWAFSVEYDHNPASKLTKNRHSKIDYRDLLEPDDFSLFSKLRQWRKEISEEENIPAYAILTNQQLADIAQNKPESQTELSKVAHLGKARLEKYGEALIQQLKLYFSVKREQK